MLLRRKCINFHNRSCSSYQNVNRRLLSWVTVLSCYLDPNLVHRAGRVYSNVDPIYRLRKRVPYHLGPSSDPTQELQLKASSYRGWKSDQADDIEDPVLNMYEELGERFEERHLRVATGYISRIL